MRLLPAGRPLVIAEAGVNHNGRLDLALRLVDEAAAAGADAVKFQTFSADALTTAGARQAAYQRRSGRSTQRAMLRRLELRREHHARVLGRCRRRGIRFMSTPFDEASADFLVSLGMDVVKVASGEATNLPFLRHLGSKRRPVLLSTGMCTLAEVAAAVRALRSGGAQDIALLHCVSCYPTAPADCNLRAMRTLERRFGLPTGFSDHTSGLAVAFAAAALGARVLEKHFTLDRSLRGPDHAMSLEPDELKALVAGVRDVRAALGDGVKRPRPCERDVMKAARRSLVLARDAAAGERLTADMLAAKRPGTGLSPAHLSAVLGRRLKAALPADALLMERHLS